MLRLASILEIPHFIFSSTAAVYSGDCPISGYLEESEIKPSSEYGRSKLDAENECFKWQSTTKQKLTVFRFFNVAGVGNGMNGETEVSNLIPKMFESANSSKKLEIYGNTWPTKDGFAIRDYVHVVDLVRFIMSSIFLKSGSDNSLAHTFNLGTGTGYSVMEVLNAFERITGRHLETTISLPRVGEVARAVSNSDSSRKYFEIDYKFGLEEIIKDQAAFLGYL